MISDKLHSIACTLAARIEARMPLDIVELNNLESTIATLATEARHMEATPIPVDMRLEVMPGTADAKVVRIDAFRKNHRSAVQGESR